MVKLRKRIRSDGSQEWRFNGILHRPNGPAIIHADGAYSWYLYGELHRTGGPAVTYADGTQMWYHHGQRHREDGPAVIYGVKTEPMYWYWDGKLIMTTDQSSKKSLPILIEKFNRLRDMHIVEAIMDS